MTITEVKQALGSWEIRLRESTPKTLLDALGYFGHIAVVPSRVNVAEYGDALLAAARYVGVFRSRSATNNFLLRGSGMAYWLGDEDGKGDVLETPVVLTAATFAASVAALLPPGGAVTAGTINAVAGTYTNTHRWQTPRQAIDYVTSTFEAEWRVNNNATLDAGTVAQLYVTDPTALIMRKAAGAELRMRALKGRMELGSDAEDYTTRVVLLAEGEGEQIALGTADAVTVGFNDLHGNDVVLTRLVSESETSADNADARAQLALNAFSGDRQSVSLSTSSFDIKGDVKVGDYVNIYDPETGFTDTSRQVYWEGMPINPIALRVVEMTYPVPEGWTVAFRTDTGVWYDLSDYYAGESGETTLVVGDLSRSLSGGEAIGIRPNLPPSPAADTTVPGIPAFTAFNTGAYQSAATNSTKAVVRVTWSTPLNVDSSVITDGAFYDLRWRVNQVIGYEVAWSDVNGSPWSSINGNPWATPLSDPVAASPEWNYMQIGWGDNEATILELTPGVEYEFQIRAVDAAYPPHYGTFSASTNVLMTGDLFAPSPPAAPVVAGSRIAIQVTHTLGKASGGTYNLEPDLDHLEVHVGGSDSFYPDDSTRRGKLVANVAMMTAGVSAVGTFQIEPTEEVHVKVVAVDRTGNRSEASASATVTAELIDNAHISDLSVDKLTAGTITAGIVLASEIEVGVGGTISTTDGQFVTKDVDGNQIIQMGLLSGGQYGMRVLNAVGDAQVEVGQLADGEYGLAAVNTLGQLVPLSRLAFGLKANQNYAQEPLDSTVDYTDLGSMGPEVMDVEVGDLGIMIVVISAVIVIGGTSTVYGWGGYMSFDVISQETGAVVVDAQNNNSIRKIFYNFAVTQADETSVNRSVIIEGLSPGLYTVRAKYKTVGTDGSHKTEFGQRTMIVLPY